MAGRCDRRGECDAREKALVGGAAAGVLGVAGLLLWRRRRA
jgi:MYXO-CTERM domain-containing protein